MSEDEISEMKRRVEQAASALIEHFDSVQILVTRHCDDGTRDTAAFECGLGNLYARLGQVREWLRIQDQYQRNWAIRKDAKDE